MNIIYRNEFEEAGRLSQVMNKLECARRGRQAVRNRRTYLYEKLTRRSADSRRAPPSRSQRGLRTGLEFFDILLSLQGRHHARWTSSAWTGQAGRNALARGMVESRKTSGQLRGRQHQAAHRGKGPELYSDADFIYRRSVRHLSDRAANVSSTNSSFLKPEALLIVGSFGLYQPSPAAEYGEWFLILFGGRAQIPGEGLPGLH